MVINCMRPQGIAKWIVSLLKTLLVAMAITHITPGNRITPGSAPVLFDCSAAPIVG